MQHEHEMQHEDSENRKPGFFASRGNIVLIGFLAVAGFYLVTEHTAHLFGVLPYLLILACPLMHVFMHGGHGERRGHGSRDGNSNGLPGDQHDR